MPRAERSEPVLPSRDLGATRAFYEALGFWSWFRGRDYPDYEIVSRGSLVLHFFTHRELAPGENDAGCYLRVADADSLHREWTAVGLPATGIPRMTAPEDREWGMREFVLVDPSGNLLRIGHELGEADSPDEPASAPRLRGVAPVFLVNDVVGTIQWYRNVLGFEAEAFPSSPPHAFGVMWRDKTIIMLQQLAGYEKPDHYAQRPGGVWDAYIRTSALAALYGMLTNRPDVRVLHAPHRQPYDAIEFEILDPNGYVLVFAEDGPP